MKASIFVDVGNLYYCVGKEFPGRKLDYTKYLEKCKQLCCAEDICEVTIENLIAYGTQLDREAGSFIGALKHIGYRTKWKYEKPQGRRVSWNVGITVDALRCSSDIIILGSSDSNLSELVDCLMSEGKTVIILALRIGRDLKQTNAKIIEIDQTLLEIKNEATS
jgi:uncharacterized LabA/DUF88 family protein